MNTLGLKLVLLTNLASTLYMVGLIWCIQLVHYPLFALVGKEAFAGYEAAHSYWLTLVVGPPMLIEAATTLCLLFYRPAHISLAAALSGALLLAVIWFSTMYLQVPQHNRLAGGFDAAAHQFLVTSNWVRTVAWSLRGALALWMTAKMMQ